MTPDQQDELRRIWALHDDAIGIELLRENDPKTLKRISDPIVLTPEVRTAGKPGPSKIEQIKDAVAKYLLEVLTDVTQPFAVEFRKLVCVEFKYCEKRVRGDFEREGFAYAMGLADTMLSWKMPYPFPVTWTVAYGLKTYVFDHLCECEFPKTK